MRFESHGRHAFVLACIDREGLGRRRVGTRRQGAYKQPQRQRQRKRHLKPFTRRWGTPDR